MSDNNFDNIQNDDISDEANPLSTDIVSADKADTDKSLKSRIKKDVSQYGRGLAASVLGGILERGREYLENANDSSGNNINRSSAESNVTDQAGKGSIFKNIGMGLIDIIDDGITEQDSILAGKIRDYIVENYGEHTADVAKNIYEGFNGQLTVTVAEKIRATMGSADAQRDAGLNDPDDVEIFADIVYGDDLTWNQLDVYRPKGKTTVSDGEYTCCDKLPVIVNFHGGAWVYGDKNKYRFYCMNLAQKGFAVVNFTYRLAPEHKFPSALEDANNVFIWMKANCIAYGLDMNNIFAVGDSAGGNLAGLYMCMQNDPAYASGYSFRLPEGTRIKAAALNCGAYDPINFIQEKELMKGLVVEEKEELQKRQLNVTEHMNGSFPPVYLMSCFGDFCLRYFSPMADALNKYGIKHIKKIFGSEEEPLHHVFHLDIRNPLANACNDEECAFLRSFIENHGQ